MKSKNRKAMINKVLIKLFNKVVEVKTFLKKCH